MGSAADGQLAELAAAIAVELLKASPAIVEGEQRTVAAAIAGAIAQNFATEAEINREAEATLASLRSSVSGMDKDTLLRGIRDRIAKRRGFVL
ncbi:MAG: hypothetical protein ACE5D3_07835 [Candidatus Binatia bacterium]